ncbi:hypothetical protein PMEGAS228_31920 [Priestia megaterium]
MPFCLKTSCNSFTSGSVIPSFNSLSPKAAWLIVGKTINDEHKANEEIIFFTKYIPRCYIFLVLDYKILAGRNRKETTYL